MSNMSKIRRKKNVVDGFRITGKTPLNGVIKVSGAKNAALPIIIATLVAKGGIYLKKCSKLERY